MYRIQNKIFMSVKKAINRGPSYEMKKEETIFFVRNLAKGLAWLVAIVAIYIFLKDRIDPDFLEWLRPFNENPSLVYLIFSLSEIITGIIPPEIFMIWGARNNDVAEYIYAIAILTAITYAAGVAAYWIGRYFNTSRYYRLLKRRFIGKYEKYLYRFGGFLIIVAATTPVPFSGVAMLVGSIRYSFKRYLFFSLSRILRFAAYSYVIWEAHTL